MEDPLTLVGVCRIVVSVCSRPRVSNWVRRVVVTVGIRVDGPRSPVRTGKPTVVVTVVGERVRWIPGLLIGWVG